MQALKLNDFLDYRFLSAVEASPNGEHIAFVVTKSHIENNAYQSCIYVYSVKDKVIKQLTTLGNEKKFIWLDNSTLLFSGMRSATLKAKIEKGEPWTAFYAIDIGGGEAVEYMRVPAVVQDFYAVSNSVFALNCVYHGSNKNPHDYPEGEERNKVLAENKEAEDYEIADEIPFRHNGPGFHNGARAQLCIFDKNENRLVPITDALMNIEFIDVKGDEVLYTFMHFYKEKPMGLTTGISVYHVKNKENKVLLPEDLYRIRYCAYMGDTIVFAASDMKTYGPNENPYFYMLENGVVTLIAENQESACNSVGSDCRMGGGEDFRTYDGCVYFTSTIGGNAVVKRVLLNGTIETVIKESGTVDCFDVSSSGIYMIAMRENRLQELYTLDNGNEICLSSFNEWVQTERSLSTPERFTFDSHGHTIEGYVMKPTIYDSSKKYPAILDIHGGHKCAYGSVFYHEMQLWANEGYFVFYCNPRGSDGGGNTFAEIIDLYGDIDYEDIMAFTDEVLVRYPAIDSTRMAVTGGSYGGFMTNWIIGHTDRFKCAATQRSISNFITQFGTSDTGYYFPLRKFVGSNIWDDFDRYWYHSPLKYAQNIKTPTLFIHSDHDFRCPVQEAYELFTALKVNGVEARLCVFKGENHELSRSGKPSHRIKRLTEITDWFNKYLK